MTWLDVGLFLIAEVAIEELMTSDATIDVEITDFNS